MRNNVVIRGESLFFMGRQTTIRSTDAFQEHCPKVRGERERERDELKKRGYRKMILIFWKLFNTSGIVCVTKFNLFESKLLRNG